MLHLLLVLALLSPILGLVHGQALGVPPHDYPGKPSGGFSPAWQQYYQVTEKLPNATFDIGRNWAGNIPVNRPNHPNDTLFFWAFEKENGSLTANAGERSNEPWGVWLNGGPGSSSMVGLLFENGPLHIGPDYSLKQNNWSWHNLADYIWIDQPVGTGFSTGDLGEFAVDEDQVASDFFGFLTNLVEVFPSLKTRPLYITGESYSGTYIPYITKYYFGLADPPVKLAKFAIGDGTVGSSLVFEELPTLSVIETYPQLIGYDTQVYEYFKEQHHLCGYDLNLTYPQNGHFPTIDAPMPSGFVKSKVYTKKALFSEAKARLASLAVEPTPNLKKRSEEWLNEKRDLSGRANGTIDPMYGCLIYEEMIEYALNFSAPWSSSHSLGGFDVYSVPDALSPEAPMDASVWLNNNVTRAAIHAPDKDWVESINYEFGGPGGNDPSVEPMAFFTDLATNASKAGVSIILYSGNDDSLVAHRGTEVVIQNTTFGGIQGFTRKPSTPWLDDSNQFAGIVHQERNLTFVLFEGAGHLVPQQQPGRAFVFLREFVLGNNQTGLVVNNSGSVTVVGGESSSIYANGLLPGQSSIFVGSGTTQSATTYPSETIDAWSKFTATAIPVLGSTGGSGGGSGGSGSSKNSATLLESGFREIVGTICAVVFFWVL